MIKSNYIFLNIYNLLYFIYNIFLKENTNKVQNNNNY